MLLQDLERIEKLEKDYREEIASAVLLEEKCAFCTKPSWFTCRECMEGGEEE